MNQAMNQAMSQVMKQPAKPATMPAAMPATKPAKTFAGFQTLIKLLVACAALSLATPAQAVISCSVTTTSVAFGTYNPTALLDNISNGTVDVSCNGTLLQQVAFSVAISTGNGTFTTRKLINGTSSLSYNLYIDPGYLTRWGDGSQGSQVASASYTLAVSPTIKSLTVYGKLPAGQTTATVGTYSDTLVISVTF